jgi:hypothetical protein
MDLRESYFSQLILISFFGRLKFGVAGEQGGFAFPGQRGGQRSARPTDFASPVLESRQDAAVKAAGRGRSAGAPAAARGGARAPRTEFVVSRGKGREGRRGGAVFGGRK